MKFTFRYLLEIFVRLSESIRRTSQHLLAQSSRGKLLTLLLLGGIFFLLVIFTPLPSIARMQAWSESIGPSFLIAFFLSHTLITITPVPRTVFTLAAGVLFGPALGCLVALTASTASALLAFWIVRLIGWQRIAARMTHPSVQALNMRLERRGWLAVTSLRLLALIPFSLLNYSCGASSIRVLPYAVATIFGLIPGTVATALLGNALTGSSDPRLLIISGLLFFVGVIGLLVDARLPETQAENSHLQ
ncbi:MAG: TVP38/TMEM64 family protein [Mycobacteriaceae bacterium]